MIRRKYLVHPRFQLRWAAFLSLLGGMIAVLFTAAVWASLDEHARLLDETVQADVQLLNSAEDVILLLLNMPETNTEDAQLLRARFQAQTEKYEGSRQMKAVLIERNLWAKTCLALFVLVIMVVLFFWGIYLTHRIAGPLIVLRRQLESAAAGKDPDFRPLRRYDEFGDVYEAARRALKRG